VVADLALESGWRNHPKGDRVLGLDDRIIAQPSDAVIDGTLVGA